MSFRRAIQLLTGLEAQQRLPDSAWSCLLKSYRSLGKVLESRGRLAEAGECYERTCTWAEKDRSERPAHLCSSQLADSYSSLMWLEYRRDRADQALAVYRRGLEAMQCFKDRAPLQTEPCLALANHHHRLGSLHRLAGRHEPALTAYRESQRLLSEVLKRDSAHFDARRLLAKSQFCTCNVLYALRRPQEALTICRQAYALTGQLLGERPLHFLLRTRNGNICFWLGKLQGEAGRQSEAIAAFREAAEIYDQLAQRSQAEPKWRNMQGTCLHCIGNRLVEMDRFAEAADHYRQAASLRETTCRAMPDHHSWHADVAGTWNHLGEMEERLGHLEEALTAYRRAIAHLRPVVQRNPDKSKEGPRLHRFCDDAARVLRRLGRQKEAVDILAEAGALRADPPHPRHPRSIRG